MDLSSGDLVCLESTALRLRVRIFLVQRMICSNQIVPHDIIQVEFGAHPLRLEPLLRMIYLLNRLLLLGDSASRREHLPFLALGSSENSASASIDFPLDDHNVGSLILLLCSFNISAFLLIASLLSGVLLMHLSTSYSPNRS